MRAFTEPEVGIVVDAGPKLGYGHAARCLRLARELSQSVVVKFYPLSEACAKYLAETAPPGAAVAAPGEGRYPRLVVTDLREGGSVTAAIRAAGSRHVSIHDLGLAQCRSDAAIDGSVVRLFPFPPDASRTLYLGPSYAMTRPPVARRPADNSVFLTLGGGLTATLGADLRTALAPLGVKITATSGLGATTTTSDAEITEAMASCRVAVSTAGTSLYDLAASGIPTIALAVDWLQLRAAEAFHERGAAISAGLVERLSPTALARHVRGLLEDQPAANRISAAARNLVDGKGLSRVAGIVHRAAVAAEQHLKRG